MAYTDANVRSGWKVPASALVYGQSSSISTPGDTPSAPGTVAPNAAVVDQMPAPQSAGFDWQSMLPMIIMLSLLGPTGFVGGLFGTHGQQYNTDQMKNGEKESDN